MSSSIILETRTSYSAFLAKIDTPPVLNLAKEGGGHFGVVSLLPPVFLRMAVYF